MVAINRPKLRSVAGPRAGGRWSWSRRAALASAAVLLSRCGVWTSSAAPPVQVPQDPTPLARCKVAANAASPLVTEWPASEKAHLQSLASSQPVAVAYSGCEMRIIDSCKPSGTYRWQRTTLATETFEIANGDELWARLPLGAAALEGELQRSGRLAVRTTVSGQLKLDGMTDMDLSAVAGCEGATHVVSAISVGSFKMLSGGRVSAGGGIGVGAVGAGAQTSRSEDVLREAGVQEACGQSTEATPHDQCASPIQVFLSPIPRKGNAEERARAEQEQVARSQGGVLIHFLAPRHAEERWTVRDSGGRELCTVPCDRWVGRRSGYYLQREKTRDVDVATVAFPDEFPHAPGSEVSAEYQPGRGSPTLSAVNFYFVGIPTAALGATVAGFGIYELAAGKDCGGEDMCFPLPSAVGNIALSTMYLGIAALSWYWWDWSQPEKLDTFVDSPARSSASARPGIVFGPGFAAGTF